MTSIAMMKLTLAVFLVASCLALCSFAKPTESRVAAADGAKSQQASGDKSVEIKDKIEVAKVDEAKTVAEKDGDDGDETPVVKKDAAETLQPATLFGKKKKKKPEPAEHYVGTYHYTSYDDEAKYRGPSSVNQENQHYQQHIDHDYYNRMNNQVSDYYRYPTEQKQPEYPKYVQPEKFEQYDFENGWFDLFSSKHWKGQGGK